MVVLYELETLTSLATKGVSGNRMHLHTAGPFLLNSLTPTAEGETVAPRPEEKGFLSLSRGNRQRERLATV